jgi:hypothetical protein
MPAFSYLFGDSEAWCWGVERRRKYGEVPFVMRQVWDVVLSHRSVQRGGTPGK